MTCTDAVFGKGSVADQDMPDGHDERVGDHGNGFLLRHGVVPATEKHHQPAVTGLQPSGSLDRGPGGLDEDSRWPRWVAPLAHRVHRCRPRDACGAITSAADVNVAPPGVERVAVPGTHALGRRAVVDLRDRGYREDEYYLSGTARRYRITDPLGTACVIDSGWPYKTRMLVRRPTDPHRFTGTVVVEWLNVTTGQDIDFV